MAAPPAPLTPEMAQQATPEGAQSAFMASGVGGPQPGMEGVQQALMAIRRIEGEMDGLDTLVGQLQPALKAKLGVAATALMSLRASLQETAKRSGMAYGSPVMPGPQPPNPGAGPPPMQ